MTENRIFNFSAGPAVLPESVLQQAKSSIWNHNQTGLGIMEMSHRGAPFKLVIEEAKTNLKSLLGAGDEWDVLFVQGGASLQFHMVPLNLANGKPVSYINTGAWSKKAIKEARRLTTVNVVASSEDQNFNYIPSYSGRQTEEEYLHFTSNNTIFGTQFKEDPKSNSFLVCDASSDFLSRPINLDPYGLIYAGAQKNLGPAGVAVVLVRKDLLLRSSEELTPYLSYSNHSENESMGNTPPTFTIYVVGEVLKWIIDQGGLKFMASRNEEKASKLYKAIDDSPLFRGTANQTDRSMMNVTFRLKDESLEKKFIEEAELEGLSGLKGHRSVGGMRASIYNAFPEAGVDKLINFMASFESSL